MTGALNKAAIACALLTLAAPAARAAPFLFNTGTTDGQAALVTGGQTRHNDVADDFVLSSQTTLTGGTLTALINGTSAATATIRSVEVEIYRVYPEDSNTGATHVVPTRVNSPSDVAAASLSSALSQISFTTTTLSPNFTAANSLFLGGINASPNQATGGDGPLSGVEVSLSFTFTTPLTLDADHYFFVPIVTLDTGNYFYWLSAARPITGAGTTPFTPDLQTWARNQDIDPDWLRVGTDIFVSTPFNMSFSLAGEIGTTSAVPEPASWAAMLGALFLLAGATRFRRG